MIKQPLHDHWTIRAVGDESEVPPPLRGLVLPARVPGCVTTDLLREGKIADPYLDENEFKTRWIGHTDWEYRTTFEADPKLFDQERIDLVADGLDTVATIVLNGTQIAQTQNMHRGYRFDVRSALKKGRNELTITFASPVKYANTMWEKLGGRPYCNGAGGRFNFIRKMACNFGWDWGPALPTCGIWRGIRLEGWSIARIERLQLTQLHDDAGGTKIQIAANLARTENRATIPHLAATLNLSDGRQFTTTAEALDDENGVGLSFTVHKPQLWWPVGHGSQPLQLLSLELRGHTDDLLDQSEVQIGLRTVELDTSPDDIGRKFVLKVNGKPIFSKGFNWIPDDCFLDRACEPARVRQRIQQAADAGGNMLRVWGGGIYETNDFYNICDELGVLVWQDFLFACAMYPEEEPFRSEIEAEARYNVARLAHHPSLAIWNGCNENIWAYRDWGWKDAVKDKTWGKNYYFDLLPKICKELTPTIPYWAGSPWSGDEDVDNGVPPNAATHGNKHVWDAPAVQDYHNYRNYEPRFASEFGVQGPSNYSTIAKVVPANVRDFGSAAMRHRQKSGDPVRDDADRKNLRQIIRDFNLPGAAELLSALDSPDPTAKVPECGCGPLHSAKLNRPPCNFDDLHYLFSVQQCRALTTAVEFWRSRQPTCWGTLYWQLNDCWPGGTTWSCVDGDGKRKPLWYATRRFFADVLETIQPGAEGSLDLCLINNTDESRKFSRGVARCDFYGNELDRQMVNETIPPRSVAHVPLKPSLGKPQDSYTREMIVVGSPVRATWFFAPDKELSYPRPEFESTLTRFDGERHNQRCNVYMLAIKPRVLLRDIILQPDRIDPDAEAEDNFFTLMPGEHQTVTIFSQRELTLEQLTAPPVFRCVNSFGKM